MEFTRSFTTPPLRRKITSMPSCLLRLEVRHHHDLRGTGCPSNNVRDTHLGCRYPRLARLHHHSDRRFTQQQCLSRRRHTCPGRFPRSALRHCAVRHAGRDDMAAGLCHSWSCSRHLWSHNVLRREIESPKRSSHTAVAALELRPISSLQPPQNFSRYNVVQRIWSPE